MHQKIFGHFFLTESIWLNIWEYINLHASASDGTVTATVTATTIILYDSLAGSRHSTRCADEIYALELNIYSSHTICFLPYYFVVFIFSLLSFRSKTCNRYAFFQQTVIQSNVFLLFFFAFSHIQFFFLIVFGVIAFLVVFFFHFFFRMWIVFGL